MTNTHILNLGRSEPGTGSPPALEYEPVGLDISSGSRRNSPPAAFEVPQNNYHYQVGLSETMEIHN